VLASAYVLRRRVKLAWPWFILTLLAAEWLSALAHTARIGFAGTLFLIGSGISIQAVRKVGGARCSWASAYG
jgi:hypothetical protein